MFCEELCNYGGLVCSVQHNVSKSSSGDSDDVLLGMATVDVTTLFTGKEISLLMICCPYPVALATTTAALRNLDRFALFVNMTTTRGYKILNLNLIETPTICTIVFRILTMRITLKYPILPQKGGSAELSLIGL